MKKKKVIITIKLDYISNDNEIEKICIKQLIADIDNTLIRKSDHFRNVRITSKKGE